MNMSSTYKEYKSFSLDETSEWGRKNYGNWLTTLQSQEYMPQTPTEEFFRYYTQGAHTFFNKLARHDEIDTYDFNGNLFIREMFYDSICEINLHPIPNDIVVYRFIPKCLIEDMLEWGNSKSLKRNSILVDKGFFSTTLSLEAVAGHPYANLKERSLFKVYIPKGMKGVYVDLVSDMHEQEMLFAPGICLQVVSVHPFGKLVECMVC